MKKKTTLLASLIIGSAIIWGTVMVGCSLALRGTECYSQIQNILAAGVSTHLILIWGPAVILLRKNKDDATDDNAN